MKRTSRFWLLALLVVGCGPEDDVQYLIESQLGPAGGIDQSENPGKNTVYDAANVQTWDGTWKTAPVLRTIVTNATLGGDSYCGLYEYKKDSRYSDSHYDAIFVAGTSYAYFSEVLGAKNVRELSLASQQDFGNYYKDGYTFISGIWKTTVDGEIKYIPCLVGCNGLNPPFVYHQRTGLGTMVDLDSIDGGITGTSYLEEPPKGKYLVRHQDRTFMFNCFDAGNRVYWSGVNDAGVFAVNIWPGSYNMDIGDGEPITGAISHKGRIVVFKERSIGIMSGDGVGAGGYSYEEVDSAHGTVSHFSIVDAGDALYFVGNDGIYQWSGGTAKNITGDKLRKTWDEFYGHLTMDKLFARPAGYYDKDKSRIIWQLDLPPENSYQQIVVNLGSGTIDRWGPFSMSNATGVYANSMFGAIYSDVLGGYVIAEYAGLKMWDDASSDSRPWFIQTQRLLDDQYTKTYRELRIDAKKTGTWSMTVLPLVDDDGPAEALRRYAGSKWNIAIDITNAAEHLVNGKSQFHAAADGPVDIFSIKTLGKAFDSAVLVANTGDTKIKFSAAKDFSTYDVGTLLIIPEDLARIYRQSMAPGTDTIGNGWELDEDILIDPAYEKIMIPINATGTSLSLYFTNLETAGTATAGQIADIKGWTVWAMPTRGMRR